VTTASKGNALSPTYRLLAKLARLDVPVDHYDNIRAELAELVVGSADTSWDDIIGLAERHGLAGLLARHLVETGAELPDHNRQQLLSLKVRHRRANRTRQAALGQVLHAFAERHIECALLKGVALVHQIYPDPALRPMSDIDILVEPDRAGDAQNCLRDIGFQADERKAGFLAEHHHLPMATLEIDGIAVHIEIHRDALSGDVNESITLDPRNDTRRELIAGDSLTYALSHVDTLRHLCHHTFEPVAMIKLGAIADLYGYACRFRDEIDFTRLDQDYPFIRNIFQLLHYLTPLPEQLYHWVTPPTVPAPSQPGYGYPPMSHILSGAQSRTKLVATLFSAPDWWLHAYYGVSPDRGLLMTRYWHHPLRVTRWLQRRARASWRAR